MSPRIYTIGVNSFTLRISQRVRHIHSGKEGAIVAFPVKVEDTWTPSIKICVYDSETGGLIQDDPINWRPVNE